jgi:hypothetical protein
MKNILYIARNIPVPGLSENDILLRIAKDINSAGNFNVDIWYPKEVIPNFPFLGGRAKAIAALPGSFIVDGFSVKSIDYFRLPTVRLSYRLINTYKFFNKRLLNEASKYDLIHAHYVLPDGFFASEAKKKTKLPFVVTLRGGDLDKIKKLKNDSKLFKIYHRVLTSADSIITHNYITEEYLNSIGLKGKSIPHGIKRDLLIGQNKQEENIILFVGNLIKYKKVNWLIESFKKINKPGWRLLIIGSGPEEDNLRSLYAGNKEIQFLGQQNHSEVISIMRRAAIFAMTSMRETFGLVFLEAAASKCAIIGTKYIGIYGWLEEDQEALYVKSEKELMFKMRKLMNESTYRRELGEKAYDAIKEKYIWEDQIIKYKKLYNSLI